MDPRAWTGIDHVAPASLGPKRDLFSYPREGWSLIAVTDVGTLRMTWRVPIAIALPKRSLKRPGESLTF